MKAPKTVWVVVRGDGSRARSFESAAEARDEVAYLRDIGCYGEYSVVAYDRRPEKVKK